MSWKNAVRNKAAWRFLLIQLVHDGLCIDYVIRFLYTDTDFSFTTGFVFRNLVELFFDVAETSMRCPSVSTSSKGLRVKPYKTQLAFFQHIQPLNDEKKPLFKSVARSWISCHTHTVWKNRKETTKRRGYCTYSRYFKIFLKIIEVRFVKFEVPTHFEQWTTWNLFYCGASTFCWTIFDCSGKPWRCHESWCFQHRWTTGDYRCKEIKRLSVFEVWRF